MGDKKIDRAALLSQVTGGKAPGKMPAPPQPTAAPAKPKGPVLTPLEQEAMAPLGWRPGDPVPESMADIFEEARIAAAATSVPGEVAAPSAESYVNALAKQQMEQALRDEAAAAAELVVERQQAAMPAGVREAARVAAQTAGHVPVIDDRTESAKEADAKKSGDKKPESDSTGAATPLAHCPNCNYNLQQGPDGPEPEHTEKMAFLHVFLGELNYLKEYSLFDGAMFVTFRTLTMPEADATHLLALNELKAGKLLTDSDYWERTLRLRLMLQLARVRTDTYDHKFPDGLDVLSNPASVETWQTRLKLDTPTSDVLLVEVEKSVVSTCLRREPIYQVIYRQYTTFNRLVRKLEVMVPNPDFWKPTAPPS